MCRKRVGGKGVNDNRLFVLWQMQVASHFVPGGTVGSVILGRRKVCESTYVTIQYTNIQFGYIFPLGLDATSGFARLAVQLQSRTRLIKTVQW